MRQGDTVDRPAQMHLAEQVAGGPADRRLHPRDIAEGRQQARAVLHPHRFLEFALRLLSEQVLELVIVGRPRSAIARDRAYRDQTQRSHRLGETRAHVRAAPDRRRDVPYHGLFERVEFRRFVAPDQNAVHVLPLFGA
ncbi:hypothetical protein ACM43_10360 [Bradyrhizobium sp. CCBAU 45321]|nr:hypothetical protein [Bradyrhizobium sp. CCBAU 45321]